MKLELVKVIDDDGLVLSPEREPAIEAADLRKLLETMWLARLLDERLLRLQRQGRIGFALASTGEEAVVVGAAGALRPGDWIHSSYREIGAALLRGFPLRALLCQMFGNAEDALKGRQMPVHHSLRHLNFVSVSSPVGTQIPHAVGAALAARLCGHDDIALTFFGDGATSTGAFHVAMNFAAVRKAACVFVCRNNGWAISVPRSLQTAAPTLAQKAVAYGVPGVLVDGNDILAVVSVVAEAATRARRGDGPTLIEARSYRRGAHSSSDDPSVYRDPDEPGQWEAHDPIRRFSRYLERKALWREDDVARLRDDFDARFRETLREVERVPDKPPLDSMFDDVLAERPWHLAEQASEREAQARRRRARTAGS